MIRRPPSSTLFPSPTLSRSRGRAARASASHPPQQQEAVGEDVAHDVTDFIERAGEQALRGALTQRERHVARMRSEEHTSELQSQSNLVCRLLLEKKKKKKKN